MSAPAATAKQAEQGGTLASDKKKKKGKKGRRIWFVLAVPVAAFLVLTGVYYGKFDTLPFGEGRFVDFMRFWTWIF